MTITPPVVTPPTKYPAVFGLGLGLGAAPPSTEPQNPLPSLKLAVVCAAVVSVEYVNLSVTVTKIPLLCPPAKYPFVNPSEIPAKDRFA